MWCTCWRGSISFYTITSIGPVLFIVVAINDGRSPWDLSCNQARLTSLGIMFLKENDIGSVARLLRGKQVELS